MGAPFPLNDRFIRFDNELAYASIADSISLSGGNRLYVTLDLFVEALPAVAPVHLAGKTATADFEFTLAASGRVSFVVRRSGGNATAVALAADALTPGYRYVLEGIDNGSTVQVYTNGQAGTSALVSSGPIVADAAAITIAGGGVGKMGLYAFQIVRDEILVCRIYVREQSGTTLKDTSDFGNDAVVSGTEDENFMYGSSHLYQPTNPGSLVL